MAGDEVRPDVVAAAAGGQRLPAGRAARNGGGRHRVRTAALAVVLVAALLAAAVLGFGLFLQNRADTALDRIDDPFAGLTDRPADAQVHAGGTGQGAPGPPSAAGDPPAGLPDQVGGAEAGGAGPGAVNPADDVDDADAGAAHDGGGAEAAVQQKRGEPVNILVLGSDSRISAGDPAQWAVGAQRTDAIMVLQIAGDRDSAYVMSIPRDSWVTIPGHGEHKINAAYSFGGPSLMVQTVEQLTGIRFDHFAIADFDSFAQLTDELGGVSLDLTRPLEYGDGKVVPEGRRRILDGEQALAYARQRYGLSGGDFSRVQRQQNWMRAVGREAFRAEVLMNPVRLTRLVDVAAGAVAVDEGFTRDRMRTLALSLRHLKFRDVRFMTAPHTGVGWSPDGRQSIVNVDHVRLAPLADAFVTDSVGEYLEDHEDDVVTLGGWVE